MLAIDCDVSSALALSALAMATVGKSHLRMSSIGAMSVVLRPIVLARPNQFWLGARREMCGWPRAAR
jgi:hypothetical protein